MNALHRLRSLPRFGDGPALTRVGKALGELDLPPGIKVTGSNGKGSTCAMIDAVLRAHRLRTGLFTSPHFRRLEERVRIDGVPVSPHTLAASLARADRDLARSSQRYSAFEALTVAAAHLFRDAGVQACVWEAGIGGRLDPTRLMPGPVAVITSVSLEHTAILGATEAAIAADKAGLASPGDTLVLGLLGRAAREAAMRADVTVVDSAGVVPPPCALAGAHQRDNARCAIAAVRAFLGPRWQPNAAVRALGAVAWPGRLQRFPGPTFVDAAHNPDGLKRVAHSMRALVGDAPVVLVFGASADRPVAEMLQVATDAATEIILTAARHKGADPERLAGVCARPATVVPRVEDALPVALNRAQQLGGAVLVTGGLFLAAEAAACLDGDDPGALAFF